MAKKLQKFLTYFFPTLSIIVIIAGIVKMRNEGNAQDISLAPKGTTNQNTDQIPPQNIIDNTQIKKTRDPLPSPKIVGTLPSALQKMTTPVVTSKTFTGNTYRVRWGNVQASIVVTKGRITGVTMPQAPNSPPSMYAKPYLVAQALEAGSANIQGVSGATHTSEAFISSLENAISKAGL